MWREAIAKDLKYLFGLFSKRNVGRKSRIGARRGVFGGDLKTVLIREVFKINSVFCRINIHAYITNTESQKP